MREVAKEREKDAAEEREGGSGALMACLWLLAALNLIVLLVVTQLPITSTKIDVVQQKGAAVQPMYVVMGDGVTEYRFQSCAGGDSVNCHRNGNYAGL